MQSTKPIYITKYNTHSYEKREDIVAIEEPLEIRLIYGPLLNRLTKQIAITMRTPTDDEALAVGFLHNEGILESYDDIMKVSKSSYHKGELNENIITIALKPDVVFDESSLNRNFYTTSSCGICGKASIDAIKVAGGQAVKSNLKIPASFILTCPDLLRDQQALFQSTGGIHACALFYNNQLAIMAEDVGRHNAMDKISGICLKDFKAIDTKNTILLLSGRASYELLQKASMNGIPIVCAVGAPSSLAIAIADELNITLIGFLRPQSFNIYTHDFRISLAE